MVASDQKSVIIRPFKADVIGIVYDLLGKLTRKQ